MPSHLVDRGILFSAVHMLNTPRIVNCPDCEIEMVKRTAYTDRTNKFWGCGNYPECTKIVEYNHEDNLSFVDYYNPSQKHGRGFSGNLFDLKYRMVEDKVIEDLSTKLYNEIATRIGLDKIDFFISIPNSHGRENPVILNLRNNGPLGQINYFTGMIEQVRTGSQKQAGKLPNRLRNVRNKYKIRDEESTIDSKILVLDDISTSGASLHEVAYILHMANEEFNYAGCVGKTKKK